MSGPEIRSYEDRAALAEALAGLLAEHLRALVLERGGARIAVAGGSTPRPMLERLGAAGLPWSNVVVTLTDERQVPPDSPRSNQRLLSETLFAGSAAAAEFVPLRADGDGSGALDAVNVSLRQLALPLDIAVLGMGIDMHTASLFPGAVGLDAALAEDAPPAVSMVAPGQEERRVTLSAPVLRAAGERHLMIAGADKRAALDRALELGDPRRAPVLAVLDGAVVHHAD